MAPKDTGRKVTPTRSNSPPTMKLPRVERKMKNTTLAQKSELIFNVSKIKNKLKKGRYAKTIRVGAAIYMTGVIEYLAAEILELSGDFAKRSKRVRITPRNIMMSIKTDTELNQLFGEVIMPAVGCLPNIHPVLLPKQTRRSSHKNKSQADESNTEAY